MKSRKKKKSGSFRRRALKASVARRSKALRARAGKLNAQLIRIDRLGYDSNGRYYGTGAPVYSVQTKDGDQLGILRASNSAAAKLKAVSDHWDEMKYTGGTGPGEHIYGRR